MKPLPFFDVMALLGATVGGLITIIIGGNVFINMILGWTLFGLIAWAVDRWMIK